MAKESTGLEDIIQQLETRQVIVIVIIGSGTESDLGKLKPFWGLLHFLHFLCINLAFIYC